jgi:membrane protein
MSRPGNGDAAGREAERPSEIPPRGWFAALKRVKAEVKDDNVSLLAAGVAFFAMLAIFPAIIALVTIYGMVADPNQIESQVAEFAKSLPAGADQLLTQQLQNVATAGRQSLSIGLVVSLLAVLWAASGVSRGWSRASTWSTTSARRAGSSSSAACRCCSPWGRSWSRWSPWP